MTLLAQRFERYATAMTMISEGVSELTPEEAASVLRSALALIETEPPAPVLRERLAPAAAPKAAGPVATRVLGYVQQHGTATTPAVAAALDITEGSANFWLRTLTNAKEITRAKRGTYEAKK